MVSFFCPVALLIPFAKKKEEIWSEMVIHYKDGQTSENNS